MQPKWLTWPVRGKPAPQHTLETLSEQTLCQRGLHGHTVWQPSSRAFQLEHESASCRQYATWPCTDLCYACHKCLGRIWQEPHCLPTLETFACDTCYLYITFFQHLGPLFSRGRLLSASLEATSPMEYTPIYPKGFFTKCTQFTK